MKPKKRPEDREIMLTVPTASARAIEATRADRADELLDSSLELAEIAQGDQRVLRLKAALDRVRCDACINERDAAALALHATHLRDIERLLAKEVATNP
jgi:alpha-D-ribose 1-methylphosphonate 5-triphosphate synthase subunit PhnI